VPKHARAQRSVVHHIIVSLCREFAVYQTRQRTLLCGTAGRYAIDLQRDGQANPADPSWCSRCLHGHGKAGRTLLRSASSSPKSRAARSPDAPVANLAIRIPPGADNYEREAFYSIPATHDNYWLHATCTCAAKT